MKGGRVRGYVVGQDTIADRTVWKVRVTDEQSSLYDDKLVVASVHDEVALASGMEVTFLVGIFKGADKAIDVRPVLRLPKCYFCEAEAEIVIEASETESGGASYWHCCLPHVVRAAEDAKTSKIGGKVLKCINMVRGDLDWRPFYA